MAHWSIDDLLLISVSRAGGNFGQLVISDSEANSANNFLLSQCFLLKVCALES